MENLKLRTVEVFKNNRWNMADMNDLKPGDLFRMKEPNGLYVTDNNGRSSWVASSKPYKNKKGVLTIKI